MKKRTRWKRCYPTIIGKEFFDCGEYGLIFFTVLKAWTCKTYSQDDTHCFTEKMILVKTRSGLKYKIPFCPWAKVVNSEGKLWGEDFGKNPW